MHLMLLSLKSLSLDAPLQQSGECVILTELILPRPSIAKKSVLKDVRVIKGKRSFAREPFYEKALLKEKVDGLFGLKVSVTRPLKHPELSQFLRQLLASGLEGGADLLSSSLLPYAPMDDVADKAVNLLADQLTEDLSYIATGGIDLDSESLSAGPLSIDLKLSERLRLTDQPPGPRSRDKRRQSAKTYRKGSTVGVISFDLAV
jgi:hypothetical protein